jgi:cytochrome P450
MIINETQRLFIVLPKLPRVATKDVQIGDLHIPKGLAIEIASQAMHYDATLWGEDVYQFNPERFANGSSNACAHPQAFLPFSVGPKFCIGNNFAVMELKLVIAMVLQRFQINVSPNYKHHPHFALVQRPKYGMQLVLKAL